MTVLADKENASTTAEALNHDVLLATMPRSGTWYSNLFFCFYFQLLAGMEDITVPPGLLNTPLVNSRGDSARMIICHAACPGFDHYQGPLRLAWERLPYHGGADYGSHSFAEFMQRSLNPMVNKKAKIIYIYRNPLDQCVSYFQHSLGHINRDRLLCYRNDKGIECRVKDEREFLFNVGLSSYIKQYLTFKLMKQICPDSILMLPYEDLSRQSAFNFLRILDFMGQEVSSKNHQKVIGRALNMCSRDSVKRIERISGQSICGDQKQPGSSHIKDGGVGRWKNIFGSTDVADIESRLNQFSLSLDEFILE